MSRRPVSIGRRAVRVTGMALALAAASAGAVSAQLLEDQLLREPLGLGLGSGQTRLEGMALRFSAPDENSEVNPFDFGDNPAGLLDDRDAWSIDARFGHRERFDRHPATRGIEFNGNNYSLFAGIRRAGKQAFGGGIDYLDAKMTRRGEDPAQYKLSRYRLLYNHQFGKLQTGLELRQQSEEVERFGDTFYQIEHEMSGLTGVLGLTYAVHDWIALGGRGSLTRNDVTGVAAGDAYEDTFDWERPSGSVDGQVYVTHPRVRGALTFGRGEGAGEEVLSAAWSPLFIYNPTNLFVRFSTTTFTEENEYDQFRTRWDVDVVPDVVQVTGLLVQRNTDYNSQAEPTVIGTRGTRSLTLDESQYGLGGSAKLLQQRLLVGAEISGSKETFEDKDLLTGYTEETTVSQFSAGGEYLVGESLALRTGLTFRSTDFEDRDTSPTSSPPGYIARPDDGGSEQLLSIGAGWVPSGGILQLDAAYTVGIGSDYDISQNQVSLYARLLF